MVSERGVRKNGDKGREQEREEGGREREREREGKKKGRERGRRKGEREREMRVLLYSLQISTSMVFREATSFHSSAS